MQLSHGPCISRVTASVHNLYGCGNGNLLVYQRARLSHWRLSSYVENVWERRFGPLLHLVHSLYNSTFTSSSHSHSMPSDQSLWRGFRDEWRSVRSNVSRALRRQALQFLAKTCVQPYTCSDKRREVPRKVYPRTILTTRKVPPGKLNKNGKLFWRTLRTIRRRHRDCVFFCFLFWDRRFVFLSIKNVRWYRGVYSFRGENELKSLKKWLLLSEWYDLRYFSIFCTFVWKTF